ncbi:MAG: hypothetical protein K2X66_06395 [Cyanobacteria bacterium]|nr:hypothetical protein [Cyanobacteriota bacterium]
MNLSFFHDVKQRFSWNTVSQSVMTPYRVMFGCGCFWLCFQNTETASAWVGAPISLPKVTSSHVQSNIDCTPEFNNCSPQALDIPPFYMSPKPQIAKLPAPNSPLPKEKRQKQEKNLPPPKTSPKSTYDETMEPLNFLQAAQFPSLKHQRVLVNFTINGKYTTDSEILVFQDGEIAVPLKTVLAFFNINASISDYSKTFQFIDPVTQKNYEINWENQAIKENGTLTSHALKHPILKARKGFLVENDLYVEAALVEKWLNLKTVYDKNSESVTLTTERPVTGLKIDPDAVKTASTDYNEVVIDKPVVKRAIIEKISFAEQQSTGYFINQTPGTAALASQTSSNYNILTSHTIGIQGSLGENTTYTVRPTFLQLNNRFNAQRVEWNITRTFPNHTLAVGNLDGGLSTLVAPNFSVWGIKYASLNAQEQLIHLQQNGEPSFLNGIAKTPGAEVALLLDGKEIQRVQASELKRYQFLPFELKQNAYNRIKVVEFQPQATPTVLYENLFPTYENLLPKGQSAYSMYMGRVPYQFYPLTTQQNNPILLPQSDKWVIGGRYFYGLTDRLTLGVSTISDRIFGNTRTPNFNTSPFFFLIPRLSGANSYFRDVNYFQGQSLGISLRYQLSQHFYLLSDIGGSFYQLRPGSPLPINQNEFGKAAQVELGYKDEKFSANVSAFHYDPSYYTTSSYYSNSLYDRQGLRTQMSGVLEKFFKIHYTLGWTHYRSNFSDIAAGGMVHANNYVGSLGKSFLKGRSNLQLNFNYFKGESDRNNEFQINTANARYTTQLWRKIRLELNLSHFYSNNVFIPTLDPQARFNNLFTISSQPFKNNSAEVALDIPISERHQLKLKATVSTLVNLISIENTFQFKHFILTPLAQITGPDSLQRRDRFGLKLGYKFDNGRIFSVSYYYNSSRFTPIHATGPVNNLKFHEFYFDFSDVLGFVGDGIKSLGPNNQQQSILTGRIFIDLNHNGKFDGVDVSPGVTSLLLDHSRIIKTDEKGYYVIANLPAGYHTVEMMNEQLPLSIIADSNIYKIKMAPSKTHQLNIPLLTQGVSIAGKIKIQDIQKNDQNAVNILLVLYNEKHEVVAYTSTDPDGNYKFINIDPGHYTLDLEAKLKNSGQYKILKAPDKIDIDPSSDFENPLELIEKNFELLQL